jgi:hypothetical protein
MSDATYRGNISIGATDDTSQGMAQVVASITQASNQAAQAIAKRMGVSLDQTDKALVDIRRSADTNIRRGFVDSFKEADNAVKSFLGVRPGADGTRKKSSRLPDRPRDSGRVVPWLKRAASPRRKS